MTIACALIALPIANYMVRYASPRMKALFYVGVMLPMWTSYLVKVYAWRLILAKQGILSWLLDTRRSRAARSMPAARSRLSAVRRCPSSYLGMFIVFVYMWLPFMILPLAAALERVPETLLQAAADLGARPAQMFRTVTLPLALPGLAAGSVFTFSLTLGDYIIPSVVGAPGYFIGMMVYQQQGTAGNIPLAAAFSVVPIVLIMIYLALARSGWERSMRSRSCRRWNRPSLVQRDSPRTPASRSCTCRCSSSFLYAFTTADRTYEFPPPGLTLRWFEAAFARSDIWAAMRVVVAGRGSRYFVRDLSSAR